MLTNLSKSQEDLMDKVRDDWLDLHFNLKEVDDKDTRDFFEYVYKLAGLGKPEVIIVDSPRSCQLMANKIKVKENVWEKVCAQVEEKVRDQFWWKVYYKVRKKVCDKVYAQVWDKVCDKVYAKVYAKALSDSNPKYYGFSYTDWCGADWISFYDYFSHLVDLDEEFLTYRDKYRKAKPFLNIMFQNTVIVSRNPTFLERDDNGDLHCLEDYAIAFADGYGQHYVHGVYFEDDLFNKFFKNKNYSSKDILGLENAEQRAVIIKEYGYESVLEDLTDKKVIDTMTERSDVTGKPINYELFECTIDEVHIRILKVECHTEHKITTLGVPADIEQTKTVKGALAWGFGLDTDKYNPIRQT